MWNVSSRSGVATLRTDIHLLLTYLQPPNPLSMIFWIRHCVYLSVCLSVPLTLSRSVYFFVGSSPLNVLATRGH